LENALEAWRYVLHPSGQEGIFYANEIISWFVETLNLTTRKEGLMWGEFLQNKGFIMPVDGSYKFEDEPIFFKWSNVIKLTSKNVQKETPVYCGKIFYNPGTDSGLIYWIILEMDLDVQFEFINDKVENDPKDKHERGAIFETTSGEQLTNTIDAIFYLIDNFDSDNQFTVDIVKVKKWGCYYEYAREILMQISMQKSLPQIVKMKSSSVIVELQRTFNDRVLPIFLKTVKGKQEDKFTVTDILLSYLLRMASQLGLLEKEIYLKKYMKSIISRDTFNRAMNISKRSDGTIYFSYGTPSCRAVWAALEMGLNFNIRQTDSSLCKTAKLNNSLFKSDSTCLNETTPVICHFLDVYDTDNLYGFKNGTPERTKLIEFSLYIMNTVDDLIARIHFDTNNPEYASPELQENKRKFNDEIIPGLVKWLSNKSYFSGNKFGPMDYIVGYSVWMANNLDLLRNCKTLKSYTLRIISREKFIESHIPPSQQPAGTLYCSYGSISSAILWAAEELNVNLNVRPVRLELNELHTEEFIRETNGATQLPVFKHFHGKEIYTNIKDTLNYLINYNVNSFIKDLDRKQLDSLLPYVESSVIPVVMTVRKYKWDRENTEKMEKASHKFKSEIGPELEKLLNSFNTEANREETKFKYFGGRERFGIMDCILGHVLSVADSVSLLETFVNLKGYVQRVTRRYSYFDSHISPENRASIDLHIDPQYISRSVPIYWLALELGVDVNLISLDPKTERKSEAFKKETQGSVSLPIFRYKDVVLNNYIAITYYMCDLFDKDGKLGGLPGSQIRAKTYRWGQFLLTGEDNTFDDIILRCFVRQCLLGSDNHHHKKLERYKKILKEKVIPILEGGIKDDDYFSGKEFGSADIILTYPLHLLNECNLLEGFERLQDYVKRIMSRDKWQIATNRTKPADTLYYWWGSRSSRAHFLALEMGIPLNYKLVNLNEGEHKSDSFKDATKGAVGLPVLVGKDVLITDSAEIVYYLVQEYDKENKWAGNGGFQKLKEWGQYITKTVDEVVMQILFHTHLYPPQKRNQSVARENTDKFNNTVVPYLEKGLQNQSYFGGSELSAIDCMMSSILLKAQSYSLLDNHPKLRNYMERIGQREAFTTSHFPPPTYCVPIN
jgi:glutathione S-transferase